MLGRAFSNSVLNFSGATVGGDVEAVVGDCVVGEVVVLSLVVVPPPFNISLIASWRIGLITLLIFSALSLI